MIVTILIENKTKELNMGVDAHFGKAQQQEEAQQYGHEGVCKIERKPINLEWQE